MIVSTMAGSVYATSETEACEKVAARAEAYFGPASVFRVETLHASPALQTEQESAITYEVHFVVKREEEQ